MNQSFLPQILCLLIISSIIIFHSCISTTSDKEEDVPKNEEGIDNLDDIIIDENIIVRSEVMVNEDMTGDSLPDYVSRKMNYVGTEFEAGDFQLVYDSSAADIYVSEDDDWGVIKAAGDLQSDIKKVTGIEPLLKKSESGLRNPSVLIGTIGKSPVIDDLIENGKIDVEDIRGKWESFVIQVVENPLNGVEYGLVIAGSDRRGTIYGIYDVSSQIGVSPWHYWADVPPKRSGTLIIKQGIYKQGEPSVKYRGIFLNDEAPCLTGWVAATFGKFNSDFYATVFELLLRLKANYIWPAMWKPQAFYADDPRNGQLAHDYGIVMGTSHHEPMARAHTEWKGPGKWNYKENERALYTFWDDGALRAQNWETLFTLGMRGDGDEPMPGETVKDKIELLDKIIIDQRRILSNRINSDIIEVPQVWAIYKEVQLLYENEMRVPGDVTHLWCDDNFGNLRRLPTAEERDRAGRAGIYYHVDYVGGPRSYKWINTVPITKIWEQMSMAYDYGADRIWIVNVGALNQWSFPFPFSFPWHGM
jgi:hypothetical protein